jgi:hypothetical protein
MEDMNKVLDLMARALAISMDWDGDPCCIT